MMGETLYFFILLEKKCFLFKELSNFQVKNKLLKFRKLLIYIELALLENNFWHYNF